MAEPAQVQEQAHPHTERPQPAEPVSELALWFGALAGLVAWALHLMVTYPLVYPACSLGSNLFIHVPSIFFALLALAGCIVSWQSWKTIQEDAETAVHGISSRAGFMALGGLISSGLGFLAVISAWAGAFIINPCLR